MFLDINPKCFEAMVDYLNDIKIMPPDCSPKMPHLGKEDDTVLQQLLLAFGLGDNGIVQSKNCLGRGSGDMPIMAPIIIPKHQTTSGK